MRKRKHHDYVVSLLTGRFVTGKVQDEFGDIREIQVFEPSSVNKYPTLQQLRKDKGHRFSDDDILTYERLRNHALKVDTSVFAKTPTEKLKLIRAKREHKSTLIKAGFNPKLRLNISEPQILRRA